MDNRKNYGPSSIEWEVVGPSPHRTVTVKGVYAAMHHEGAAQLASANYHAGVEQEAFKFMDALDPAARFELTAESYSMNRYNSLCRFTRRYDEVGTC